MSTVMKRLVVLLGVATLWPQVAFAAGNSSTATGTAVATVVSPLTIQHSTGTTLNFGKFTAGTGGTVVVTPASAGSTTAGVAFVPGSSVQADQFFLTGDPNRNFAIAASGGTISAGASSMNFSVSLAASTGTLDPHGYGNFFVGGTLTVANNQAVGSYTGSYSVTVTYN